MPRRARILLSVVSLASIAALSLTSTAGATPVVTRAAAQAPGQPTTQERLARVRADLFSRGERIAEDIAELKAILAVEPGSVEAHLLLGIAYRTQGTEAVMGEAVAELRQAVALDPTFVPARFYLAHLYIDLGRSARAREELEAGLALAPANVQFLALLGETERQLNNPTRTVELTRQALQIDPTFTQARYYLGIALFGLGQRTEAIKELEQVVQSGARVADAYLALGTAYLEVGRTDEALKVLTEGTQIDAARGELRIQLARAYRTQGALAKAEAQLAQARPRAGSSVASPFSQQRQLEFDFHVEEGLLRAKQGRLQAAAEAFRKVLAIDPNHGPTNRDLASVYLHQGLYSKASDHAARATTLGFPLPENERALLQEKLRTPKPAPRK